MSYIQLNGTDIKVSKIALGTATFGKDADEETSFMLSRSNVIRTTIFRCGFSFLLR